MPLLTLLPHLIIGEVVGATVVGHTVAPTGSRVLLRRVEWGMAKRSKKQARQAARRAERREAKRDAAPTPDPKALLLKRIFTEASNRHDEDARRAEREREREWLAEERRRARGR